MYDKNLYAYCDNNSVMRKDETGDVWIASIAAGFAIQYVGDVVQNVQAGETGWNIFKFRSSAGNYIASMVTYGMPGSSVVSNLAQNVIKETILCTERYIKGQKNNLRTSISTVVRGTIKDSVVNIPTSKVSKYIKNKTDKTYSQYASNVYKRNPNASRGTIQKQARRTAKWGGRIAKGIEFFVGLFG